MEARLGLVNDGCPPSRCGARDFAGWLGVCLAMNAFVTSEVLPEAEYYTRMRNAARELGFKGWILWTDLVKCSVDDKKKLPGHEHRQTYSRCMNAWLRTEFATFENKRLQIEREIPKNLRSSTRSSASPPTRADRLYSRC